MLRGALLVLLLGASACAPQACSDADERALARDVELVVNSEGAMAAEAAARLVGRGRVAIVHLEAGLYEAEPAGRRRIIRVLVDLGHPDGAAVLVHLARRDVDPDVRAAAAAGLARLGGRE